MKRFFVDTRRQKRSVAGLHEHFGNAVAAEKIESRTKRGFLEVPSIWIHKMFLQSILASVEQISGTVIGIERTCRRIPAELKVREEKFSTLSLVPRSLFGWISLPRIRASAMGMRFLGTPFLINTLSMFNSFHLT